MGIENGRRGIVLGVLIGGGIALLIDQVIAFLHSLPISEQTIPGGRGGIGLVDLEEKPQKSGGKKRRSREFTKTVKVLAFQFTRYIILQSPRSKTIFMPSAIQFVKPDTTAETKLRNYIREQITLRSQPAKLRKLFLKLGRDHRGRFNFVAFRKAILQIGCRTDVIDANKQTTLKAVFKTCAPKGRMSWSDFAKMLVLPEEGTDLSDTFTGRLKGGAGSIRELKRMEVRDHHQSEIRSGGIQFFVEIYKTQILQRGLTHPSLELVYKRNDSNKDGKLTVSAAQRKRCTQFCIDVFWFFFSIFPTSS